MPYKIVFTDIDGTLLDAHRDLSAHTIAQIKRLQPQIPVVLVSARMPRQMTHLQEKLEILNTPLICYNGALVLADNQIVHSQEIEIAVARSLVLFNESRGANKVHISLFHQDEWFVETYDYWAQREENNTKAAPDIKSNSDAIQYLSQAQKGVHKITCMGEAAHIEEMFAFLHTHYRDSLHLYRSKDTYIEIASKEVSKLTGIRKLLDAHYKMELQDVVAFGDNYNDTEMIAAVGHGVAVANARDEVKAVAKAITAHHKEDGVAKYLEKIFA